MILQCFSIGTFVVFCKNNTVLKDCFQMGEKIAKLWLDVSLSLELRILEFYFFIYFLKIFSYLFIFDPWVLICLYTLIIISSLNEECFFSLKFLFI